MSNYLNIAISIRKSCQRTDLGNEVIKLHVHGCHCNIAHSSLVRIDAALSTEAYTRWWWNAVYCVGVAITYSFFVNALDHMFDCFVWLKQSSIRIWFCLCNVPVTAIGVVLQHFMSSSGDHCSHVPARQRYSKCVPRNPGVPRVNLRVFAIILCL